MKKVFFSAIMMIAFSGVSMANDIAEEKTLVEDPCQDVCHLAYNLARSEGANHQTADAYADLVYINCVKSNKPQTLKKN